MFRFLLVAIPLLAALLLAGLIYLDLEETGGNPQEAYVNEPPEDAIHANLDDSIGDSGMDEQALERVLEIEQRIEGLDDETLKVAFLGEIARIYRENDRLDGAGEARWRMAGITGDFEDWKLAGDHYYGWLEQEANPDRFAHFSERILASYRNAAERQPDNPDILTDLAVAYHVAGDVQTSIDSLKAVIERHPQHMQAHYNLGVLLLEEREEREESFSYLERSLELAEDDEQRDRIRQTLQHEDSDERPVDTGSAEDNPMY